jgi:monoterpene epsilon-lactone hydrolase
MQYAREVIHPVSPQDVSTMALLRTLVAPMKGKLQGISAREPFNALMEQVVAPAGVTFATDTVGPVGGVWVRPARSQATEAILHLHGGWFSWGTAHAFRNLVGHIAARSGTQIFIPDYRLAPEHPFPAALHDVQAAYRGLEMQGVRRIAVTGDSAGGNLALVLLGLLNERHAPGGVRPAGAVVLSPVTDLTLSGRSYETRADADPYFVRAQVSTLVQAYLGDADPQDPRASPLFATRLAALPPLRVHVGDDEVLLDDSRRFVERAVAAGADAQLHVWLGMPHGFSNAVGKLEAAAQALDAAAAFLGERLASEQADR